MQLAARQPHAKLSLCVSCQNAGHDHGTGAGAARQRLSRAAFPDAHRYVPRSCAGYKLRVDSTWERGVIFDQWPDSTDKGVIESVHKSHAMWIAHGNASDFE